MSAEPPRYQPAEHVVMTEYDGEAVLLDVASGVYYGLDEVGARVWRMLEWRTPVDGIVRALLERYDVVEPRLRADVERLVAELLDADLITSRRATP